MRQQTLPFKKPKEQAPPVPVNFNLNERHVITCMHFNTQPFTTGEQLTRTIERLKGRGMLDKDGKLTAAGIVQAKILAHQK